MSFESAERVQDAEGRQYHIGLAPGEVAPRVLLVGDPQRADRVASRFDKVLLTQSCREYVTRTGTWRGLDVTVLATGIGCDNTEIAVVELLQCQRHPVLIRVGSSGGLKPHLAVGDIVISTGSVRIESTSLGFVEPGYPAVAHHEVVLALISAAEAQGAPYHVGLTATASGFYGWQGRRGNLVEPRDPDLVERLARQNVLNFEMEASTLFTLGSLASVRTGAVCALFANRPANQFISSEMKGEAEDRAIDVGLEALLFLEHMDTLRGTRPFHLPRP